MLKHGSLLVGTTKVVGPNYNTCGDEMPVGKIVVVKDHTYTQTLH